MRNHKKTGDDEQAQEMPSSFSSRKRLQCRLQLLDILMERQDIIFIFMFIAPQGARMASINRLILITFASKLLRLLTDPGLGLTHPPPHTLCALNALRPWWTPCTEPPARQCQAGVSCSPTQCTTRRQCERPPRSHSLRAFTSHDTFDSLHSPSRQREAGELLDVVVVPHAADDGVLQVGAYSRSPFSST